MSKRILCIGRKVRNGWALVQEGERPLPVPTRRLLERYYPTLPGDDVTPEECERWFARTFEPKPVKE